MIFGMYRIEKERETATFFIHLNSIFIHHMRRIGSVNLYGMCNIKMPAQYTFHA